MTTRRCTVYLIITICVITRQFREVAAAPEEQSQFNISINLFISKNNSDCITVQRILEKEAERDGVDLVIFDLADSEAVSRRDSIATAYGIEKPVVPMIYGCNQVINGYEVEVEFRRVLNEMLSFYVFIGDGCPKCPPAIRFMKSTFASRYPGFRIEYRNISKQPRSNDWLQRTWNSNAKGKRVPRSSVPALYFCKELHTFYGPTTMRRRLDEVLKIWTPASASSKDPRDRH